MGSWRRSEKVILKAEWTLESFRAEVLGLKITKVGFYLAIHWLLRQLKAGKILIGNVKLGNLLLGGERALFIA